MSPLRHPTDEEGERSVRLMLEAFGREGRFDEVMFELAQLHPPHKTFPGELFTGVGADALAEAGVGPGAELSHVGMREQYLSDYELRGKRLQKLRYAMLCVTARHSGVEPDLLDEVAYWGSDDFWHYALMAAIA